MKIKATIASVLLGIATLSSHASAAAPLPVRMQVWEIVRTSWAPSQLAIGMDAGYSDSRTVLGVTYLRHDRSGVKVLPGAHLSSSEGTTSPQAYAAGERVACPNATVCTPANGYNLATVYYNDNGKNDPLAPDTVIVVTYGRGAKVSLAGGAKQWRVRKVSRTVRVVWSSDGDSAAGVWHNAAGAEVFTTASVKGGPRGSVAIGVPPCAGTPVGTGAGVGTATLAGGVKTVQTNCPQDVQRPSQVAKKATTWNFSGTVVGLTARLVSEPGTVRLLVVDF